MILAELTEYKPFSLTMRLNKGKVAKTANPVIGEKN